MVTHQSWKGEGGETLDILEKESNMALIMPGLGKDCKTPVILDRESDVLLISFI
jgi:hypothetical protein